MTSVFSGLFNYEAGYRCSRSMGSYSFESPCLTAGFMVLPPYTFVTIVITGKLIVLQQLMIEVYLCTFSLGRMVPLLDYDLAFFFLLAIMTSF